MGAALADQLQLDPRETHDRKAMPCAAADGRVMLATSSPRRGNLDIFATRRCRRAWIPRLCRRRHRAGTARASWTDKQSPCLQAVSVEWLVREARPAPVRGTVRLICRVEDAVQQGDPARDVRYSATRTSSRRAESGARRRISEEAAYRRGANVSITTDDTVIDVGATTARRIHPGLPYALLRRTLRDGLARATNR
jgi:hypothetical protein